jgi:hypothetical protein
MTSIDGKSVRLLETRTAPGCLIDVWETPEPRLPDSRTGVVVTVMVGQETAAEPFHGWAGLYGYAVVTAPADDPVERFQEALRQDHDRHQQRHTVAHFVHSARAD